MYLLFFTGKCSIHGSYGIYIYSIIRYFHHFQEFHLKGHLHPSGMGEGWGYSLKTMGFCRGKFSDFNPFLVGHTSGPKWILPSTARHVIGLFGCAIVVCSSKLRTPQDHLKMQKHFDGAEIHHRICFLHLRDGSMSWSWSSTPKSVPRIMMVARFNLYAQSLIQLCAKVRPLSMGEMDFMNMKQKGNVWCLLLACLVLMWIFSTELKLWIHDGAGILSSMASKRKGQSQVYSIGLFWSEPGKIFWLQFPHLAKETFNFWTAEAFKLDKPVPCVSKYISIFYHDFICTWKIIKKTISRKWNMFFFQTTSQLTSSDVLFVFCPHTLL